MADSVRTLTCPSCGAPLKVGAIETRVQCQYCHATVELSDDNQPPVILIGSDIPEFKVKPYKVNPLPVILWLVFFFVVLPGLIIGLIFVFSAKKGIATPLTGVNLRSVNNIELLSQSGGATSDVIGLVYDSDSKIRMVYLDFDQANPLVWKSDSLGDKAYLIETLADGDVVAVAETARLFALRKSDGAKMWETSLSDQLPVACDSCLQMKNGKIFALTQIGTLHAFDAASGQQVWSAGLNSTPRNLLVFDAGPAVIDKVDEKPAIIVFDGQTGQRLQQIQPACPNNTFQDDVQDIGSTSNFWQDPAGQFLYLAYGFWDPTCFEKWNPADGTRLYQSLLPEGVARSDLIHVMDDGMIYFSPDMDGTLFSVKLSDGAANSLLDEENYDVRPLFAQDQILVAEVKRTRGSTRYELWGIDTQSGQRLWQVIPQGIESLENEASTIMDSEGGFFAHEINGGMSLVQVFDDPARLTFDVIDVKTGVSQNQISYTMPESTIFSLDLINWKDNQFWIESDGIYAFDVTTGQPLVKWP